MRVEPDGPIPCKLALFGENPGFEEQREGRGFVGKSGQQLWSDMKRFTGLTRANFYVSNIVKEGLPKGRDPKPEEVARAMPEFLDELDTVKPRIVVTAGGLATRVMLGNVAMSDVHGIPHTAEICGQSYTVLPIYHPAAGLHNKGFLSAFAYDLDCFKRLLAGDLKPWAPAPIPVSKWLSPPDMGRCGGFLSGALVAVDTEGWTDRPWGLSFSPDGLLGFVIKATDEIGLAWFATWLSDKTVVMHNGVHDVPVLRAMGIPVGAYHDAQVLAYHDMIRTGSGVLEAESQNLGTLAYRSAGMVLGELHDCPGVDLASRVIPYTDAVKDYAGADPIATYRLFKFYEQRGIVNSLPYKIDMGQVGLVGEMIDWGIPFDADAAVSYYADVLDKLEVCTADLRKQAARYGNRDFNPGSHPQVRELLTRKIGLRLYKRTKGGLASTNEKALADHKDVPFVQKLQTYRELVKLKGTYVEPLLEALQ